MVNFLERLAGRLRIQGPDETRRNPVESRETVEVFELNSRLGDRRTLSENQIQTPIGGGGYRRASGANGSGENLGLIDPRDEPETSIKEREDEEYSDCSTDGTVIR